MCKNAIRSHYLREWLIEVIAAWKARRETKVAAAGRPAAAS